MSEHTNYTPEGRQKAQEMQRHLMEVTTNARKKEKETKAETPKEKKASAPVYQSPDLTKLKAVWIPEIRAHIYIDKRKDPQKAVDKYLERLQKGKSALKARSTSSGLSNAKAKEIQTKGESL